LVAGSAQSFLGGASRKDLADTVTSVEDGNRPRVDDEFGRSHRVHDTRADPIDVPGESQHAVRRVLPQVSGHQRIRDQGGIGGRHAVRGENRGAEGPELVRGDLCGIHSAPTSAGGGKPFRRAAGYSANDVGALNPSAGPTQTVRTLPNARMP